VDIFGLSHNLYVDPAGDVFTDGNIEAVAITENAVRVMKGNNVSKTSTTVANTTTETNLFTTTYLANTLRLGEQIRLRLRGRYSTNGALQICTLRVKFGGTTIHTQATASASVTNVFWTIDTEVTIRTLGAAGTAWWYDIMRLNAAIFEVGATAAQTIDTTGSLALTVTAQWSAANANNTISADQASCEYLG
jgi:hypothetical protein